MTLNGQCITKIYLDDNDRNTTPMIFTADFTASMDLYRLNASPPPPLSLHSLIIILRAHVPQYQFLLNCPSPTNPSSVYTLETESQHNRAA